MDRVGLPAGTPGEAQDDCSVDQAPDGRRRLRLVGEEAPPVVEARGGGDEDRRADLVARSHEAEEVSGGLVAEARVAEVVNLCDALHNSTNSVPSASGED